MLLLDKPDIDSLWDFSDPEKSEENFCDNLLQFREDDPDFLELLTQIARAQGLQHKFEKAHHTLDQVERRIGKVATRANVRYLLERGRVLNASGSADQARLYFEQALDMAGRLAEDFYTVDAIHMLAIVASPASALDLILRAIEMAESSPQTRTREWLGSLYRTLGWIYHDAGDYPSALKAFQKAEAFHSEKGGDKELRAARWCVARALRSMGCYKDSLGIQRRLKEELEASHRVDGYVFEEIAECLLGLNRTKQARTYFKKAYEALSRDDSLVERQLQRVGRLKNLGEVSKN